MSTHTHPEHALLCLASLLAIASAWLGCSAGAELEPLALPPPHLSIAPPWSAPLATPSRLSATPSAPPATPSAAAETPKAAAPADSQLPTTVSFLAVGDVLLSRQVAGRIQAAADPLLPFRAMAAVFDSVDFCFANLESPFSREDSFSLSSANIFNTPKSNLRGLVDYRFRVVNLANNHMLDQNEAGLRITLELLTQAGIRTVGAGMDEDEAWRTAVLEVRGMRLGFVGASYASVNDGGVLRRRNIARIEDEQRLRAAIQGLRAQADLVVATMHAGAEYNSHVQPAEVRFAHAAIDFGADVVFGSHPHVLQRVERYQGKYIFYSLGNFIFDHKPLPTRQGLAVRVRATLEPSTGAERRGAIAELELLPVLIENLSTPRLATAEEARSILSSIGVTEPLLHPSAE